MTETKFDAVPKDFCACKGPRPCPKCGPAHPPKSIPQPIEVLDVGEKQKFPGSKPQFVSATDTPSKPIRPLDDKSSDRAFRTGWNVLKMPFEDHAWAQGSPYAETQYNKLVGEQGMEAADAGFSNPDVMELIDTVKQMIQAAESGMSGMSTRNAYGAYLSMIPRLGEQLGSMDAAVHILLMAGANKQGVMDAVQILRGGR